MSAFSPQFSDELKWILKEKYRLNYSAITEILNTQSFVCLTDPLLQKKVETDAKRLVIGEPVAYIIGFVHFLNCEIDLSLRPLIPRPETEYWVGELIKEWSGEEQPRQVLDLCCGSGCIGIALLKNLPDMKVDFVDISTEAVEQTQLNLSHNRISSERFQVIQSDLFSELKNSKYSVIISNPPYVDPNGEVSPELKWEPAKALFAQKEGFGLIEQILIESKKHLIEGGELVLEFGKGQEKEIERMAKKTEWRSIKFLPDQFGIIRWGRFRL